MNKPIRKASFFCLLLTLAVLVRVVWVQALEGEAIADNSNNRRNVIERYAQPLGDIVVAGRAVTGSERTTGGDLAYRRTYTEGELYAPVVGYSSQVYGATQLEGIYQDILDGSDRRLKNSVELLTNDEARPGHVITTVDPEVQRAGFDALGGKKGAAVAMDPASGEILGMVSAPSYNPSLISGSTSDDEGAWRALSSDKDQPMLNRALRKIYSPGSAFKLVVAAAALEEGLYQSVDQATASEDPYRLDRSTVLRNENAAAPCENATIRTALQFSCNTVFAKMAVDLGEERVRAMAEKFGFNAQKLDVPVRAATSVYPSGMNQASTALTGIGQFDVSATPLQMAMVTAALANGGKMAAPRMVSQVVDSGGRLLEGRQNTVANQVVGFDTAQQLQDAMVTVVEKGTGSNARIGGVRVGGKTGTAQRGVDNSEAPYAWFVSYAEDAQGKQVAVAVVVEESDAARSEVSGNKLAAPIAKRMMEAALR